MQSNSPLALAREQRGLSLEQVAQTTGFDVADLAELEQNALELESKGIDVRPALEAYASAVGLDPAWVLDNYAHPSASRDFADLTDDVFAADMTDFPVEPARAVQLEEFPNEFGASESPTAPARGRNEADDVPFTSSGGSDDGHLLYIVNDEDADDLTDSPTLTPPFTPPHAQGHLPDRPDPWRRRYAWPIMAVTILATAVGVGTYLLVRTSEDRVSGLQPSASTARPHTEPAPATPDGTVGQKPTAAAAQTPTEDSAAGRLHLEGVAPASAAPPSATPPRPDLADPAPAPGFQKVRGSGDLNGWWEMATFVESSADSASQGLRSGYLLRLQQDGNRVNGRGQKRTENGREVPEAKRTPITIAGVVEGNRVALTFIDDSGVATNAGTYNLELTDDGLLRGKFATPTNSQGISVAHPVSLARE